MLSWILITIIVFLCSGLGSIVYFKDPRGKINKIFIVLVSLVVIWLLSNYLENEPIDPFLASLFLRIDFASAALLVYFFFLFAINFQGNYLISSVSKQALALLPSLALSILSFSTLIITQIEFENHTISFERGPLFPLYAVFLISYVTIGCSDLFLKYKKLKGLERIQTLYVLLGFSISAFIALFINLFFQQLLPVEIFRIGNYGIFFFIGFTAYAIISRQLFDIRVILSEILVGVIAIILFIQTMTADILWLKILNGSVFILFCIFGYLLIKATIREIEMRREVERLSKAKSEFISIASHQLRTPLSAIKGYISMILEGTYGELNERAKRPMENVYQSNERLIKLVNDLLNLSRLDAGKIKFEPKPTSLEEMIKGILEELRVTVENKGLYIRMEKPTSPLPEITVDQDHIRQVVLNIIDNAIKYTKEGGITIELSKIDDTEQIKISDTGEGMDEKELESLFQMFSRATAGAQLHTEGAGIGLYVARQFVEMHGGKIWAKSKGKGKGSTFIIQIPIHLASKLLKNKTKDIT